MIQWRAIAIPWLGTVLGVAGVGPGMDDAIIANKLFEATVEDKLVQPMFVTEYPAAFSTSSAARLVAG
jgi:F0F1-type ATP synthase membrane subunit c/vacuolar-type H+-ATPase subunit K